MDLCDGSRIYPRVYEFSYEDAGRILCLNIEDKYWDKVLEINKNFYDMGSVDVLSRNFGLVYTPLRYGEHDLFGEIHWGFGRTILSAFGGPTLRFDLSRLGPYYQRIEDNLWWKKSREIQANLFMILQACNYVLFDEAYTEEDEKQVAHVVLECSRHGYNGSSIWVTLLEQALLFLKSKKETYSYPPIEKIMREAHNSMAPPVDTEGEFFTDRIRIFMRPPHWINLSVPGDACGLDPRDYYDDGDIKYDLLPHNVDRPLQQITLLMGIAALTQEIREWQKTSIMALKK